MNIIWLAIICDVRAIISVVCWVPPLTMTVCVMMMTKMTNDEQVDEGEKKSTNSMSQC